MFNGILKVNLAALADFDGNGSGVAKSKGLVDANGCARNLWRRQNYFDYFVRETFKEKKARNGNS